MIFKTNFFQVSLNTMLKQFRTSGSILKNSLKYQNQEEQYKKQKMCNMQRLDHEKKNKPTTWLHSSQYNQENLAPVQSGNLRRNSSEIFPPYYNSTNCNLENCTEMCTNGSHMQKGIGNQICKCSLMTQKRIFKSGYINLEFVLGPS